MALSWTLAELLQGAFLINSFIINLATEENRPLSAFVWWLIPLFAFIGSVGYVIWVSKFKSRYENQTNRSVDRFQKFQNSFDDKGC
ncbi:MAG: hypothetical protein ACKO29_06750 [Actinomycetota bacterium]